MRNVLSFFLHMNITILCVYFESASHNISHQMKFGVCRKRKSQRRYTKLLDKKTTCLILWVIGVIIKICLDSGVIEEVFIPALRALG